MKSCLQKRTLDGVCSVLYEVLQINGNVPKLLICLIISQTKQNMSAI